MATVDSGVLHVAVALPSTLATILSSFETHPSTRGIEIRDLQQQQTLCAAEDIESPSATLAVTHPPHRIDLISAWEQDQGTYSAATSTRKAAHPFALEAYVCDDRCIDVSVVTYALFVRGIPCVVIHQQPPSRTATIRNVASESSSSPSGASLPSESSSLSAAVRNHALFIRAIVTSRDEEAEEEAENAEGVSFRNGPRRNQTVVTGKTLEEVCTRLPQAFVSRRLGHVGRIFVIEGGDGAGKQTQTAMIVERMAREHFPVATLDYPHDAARYGMLIREVLGGLKGPLKAVSPLVFSSLYGLNRHATLPVLTFWMRQGRNIILDRYMSANFGHQASKFDTAAEREAAIASLKAFEESWLGLPSAHRVCYLNLPAEVAYRAMLQDTSRKELDLHELAGIEYKNNVRRAFLWCCEHLPGWSEIPCVRRRRCGDVVSAAKGEDAAAIATTSAAATTTTTRPCEDDDVERISRQEIHETIYASLKPDFV